MAYIFSAALLRDPDRQLEDFWKQPGWYRWWAMESSCTSLFGPFADQLLPHLSTGDDNLKTHFLIYVGITKQTLLSRVVRWHIREKHGLGKFQHRTLSTFRQTISSLAAGSWADESATNAVIDQLKVEVYPVEMPVGSVETRNHLLAIEEEQVRQHLVPLNLQGNHDPRLLGFHRYLKDLRRSGRSRALQESAVATRGGR